MKTFDPKMGDIVYAINMDEQRIKVERIVMEPDVIGPVFRSWEEAQIMMERMVELFRVNARASDFPYLWQRNYAAGGVI